MSIVELKNCSFMYPNNNFYAVNNLSLEIEKGEFIALVGSNGSGKSTLSKLLVGLLFANNGSIIISDLELNSNNVWLVREKIGIVFQNPDQQFIGTTVADDVAFGLENQGINHNEMVKRVDSALRAVNMAEFKNVEPSKLSGGQKQRVALAGIMAREPEIIILDESTSMLDPIGKADVLNNLNKLKMQSDVTILMITHDMEEALRADRIFVMKKGNIIASGSPERIFKQRELLLQAHLKLPFSLQMTDLLHKHGIMVDPKLNMEGLVDELCKLNFKM